MKAATLKALKGSIRKWEGIVAGTKEDKGQSNCPLCKLFLKIKHECKGCPVYQSTGQTNCQGTPYMEWLKAGLLDSAFNDKQKIAAVNELRFLRSLLPKGSK